MLFLRSLVVAAAFAASLAAAGPGPGPRKVPRGDQDAAFEALKRGRIMPLKSLESRVIPHFPGASYIGPEFDSDTQQYRMKFIRGGRVIWVDVDARSGRILDQSGD